MELGKLGMVEVIDEENGNRWEYQPYENPLLLVGVTGGNAFTSYRHPMSPDYFAKPNVAAAIAAVVGGKVVVDPISKGFDADAPMLAITANGRTVNAARVGMVMGNDAYKASVVSKGRHISELFGIFPLDDLLADKIWSALGL